MMRKDEITCENCGKKGGLKTAALVAGGDDEMLYCSHCRTLQSKLFPYKKNQ